MSQVLAGCCCIQGDDGCVCGKAPLTAYVINYTARFKVASTTTTRPNECLTGAEYVKSLVVSCHDLVVTGSIPVTVMYVWGTGVPTFNMWTCGGGMRACDVFRSFQPNVGDAPRVINCEDGEEYFRVPGFGVANTTVPFVYPIFPQTCPSESLIAYENTQDGQRYGVAAIEATIGCPNPTFGGGHYLTISFGSNNTGRIYQLSGDFLTKQCFAPMRPVSDQGPFMCENGPYTPPLIGADFGAFSRGGYQQIPSMNDPRGTYTWTGRGCSVFPNQGLAAGVSLDSVTATVV